MTNITVPLDRFALYSEANDRDLGGLFAEFTAVRQSTAALFRSFSDAALIRAGTADGHHASVRALAYHIAGHELRHMNIIRERYL